MNATSPDGQTGTEIKLRKWKQKEHVRALHDDSGGDGGQA